MAREFLEISIDAVWSGWSSGVASRCLESRSLAAITTLTLRRSSSLASSSCKVDSRSENVSGVRGSPIGASILALSAGDKQSSYVEGKKPDANSCGVIRDR